jgi:hypothetical protein
MCPLLRCKVLCSHERRGAIRCAGKDTALGWYSDSLDIELEVSEEEFKTRAPSALSEIPADDPENPGSPLFLSADHPWFVAMQKVRP